MTSRAVYLHRNEFHFDLQKCLSPTPTVSNEVVHARMLNGKTYTSLQTAIESELKALKKLMAGGLNFIDRVESSLDLPQAYSGKQGDCYYCVKDALYYAWNGTGWFVCGDASKIADGSVTPIKTSFITGSGYPNLFENNSILRNKLLNNIGGTDDNGDFDTNLYGIPVTENCVYSCSINGQSVYIAKVVFKTADNITATEWNEVNGTFISVEINTGFNSITAPANAKYMFLSITHHDQSISGDFSQLVVQKSQTPQPISDAFALSTDVAVPQCLKSNLCGLTMMTLGDSLSEGGYWQEYVKDYTGLGEIKNLAVGGTKINVFADAVTPENIANVDIVFVMGLFNSAASQPGTVADAPSKEENASVCAGYKYIVERLYSLKPSLKIVLASPHRPQANDVGEKAKAVGAVAAYYGIPFIDLYNTAGFNDFTYSLYLRDNVHSSHGRGGGYEQEAKVIAGGLIQYFG
ncbi:MAG: SGNH/GDSL hydrolase family protein [Clostridia bacterium]|nr:SGNH/GDSL hydrolase family protein [Clostridia bacterium]